MSPSLKSAQTTAFSRIMSVAGVRGDLIVPNDALAGPIDSSDEWIQRRTGIVTRRRAPKDVLVQDLAEQAGRKAVEAAGIEPSDIDVVIVRRSLGCNRRPGWLRSSRPESASPRMRRRTTSTQAAPDIATGSARPTR